MKYFRVYLYFSFRISRYVIDGLILFQENHDLIRELRKLQKSNIKDIEDASSNVLFLLIDKDIIIKDGK